MVLAPEVELLLDGGNPFVVVPAERLQARGPEEVILVRGLGAPTSPVPGVEAAPDADERDERAEPDGRTAGAEADGDHADRGTEAREEHGDAPELHP